MEIEAIQDLISDDEETRKRIDELHEKRFRMKQEIEAEKKRLTDALLRRGFSWGEVRSAWSRYGSEIWEE